MNKWVIFIILKIIEFLSLFLIFLGLSLFGQYLIPASGWFSRIFVGFIMLSGCTIGLFVVFLLYQFITEVVIPKNMEWADKLSEKWRR